MVHSGGDVGGEGFQEAGMGGKLLVGWLTTEVAVVATGCFTFEAVDIRDLVME